MAEPDGRPLRDVRAVGDRVEWRCRGCTAWNELQAATCRTCGTSRTGFDTRTPSPARRLGLPLAVGLSLLLPGLGHVVAGRLASGCARALLTVGWIAAGVAVLRATPGTPAGGVLLVAAGCVVVGGTLLDARTLADPDVDEVLDMRRIAWLVGVVAAGLVVATVAMAVRGT